MSNLGRLYTYAKGGADAKEDFTTEALAICLRHDADSVHRCAPCRRACSKDTGRLRQRSSPSRNCPFPAWVASTSSYVWVGATLEECWFEVKVDAPETGDQLARYATHVSALPAEGRPQLIVLAREPIRVDGPPLLPWKTVHAAARSSATPPLAGPRRLARGASNGRCPRWTDLARRARSPSSGHQPLREAVSRAGRRLPRAWHLATRSSRGPGAARSAALSRGAQPPRPLHAEGAALQVGGSTLLYFGIEGPEFSDPRGVGGWSRTRSTARSDGRSSTRRIAAAWTSAWVRQLATWQGLRVAHPTTGPIDQRALATWYVERVDELATAGVLELLPRLGRGTWIAGGP